VYFMHRHSGARPLGASYDVQLHIIARAARAPE
jgi:hypothetical protein